MTEARMAAGIVAAGGLAIGIWLVASHESADDRTQRIQLVLEAQDRSAQEALKAAGRPDARVFEAQALSTCQRAIRQAARDPEKAVVPDVGAARGGADWRFQWSEGSRLVRMRNGLGLDVAVHAFCVVDEKSGSMKLLAVDGRQIVGPAAGKAQM